MKNDHTPVEPEEEGSVVETVPPVEGPGPSGPNPPPTKPPVIP